MTTPRSISFALALALLATGCVSQGRYDDAVKDAASARAELDRTKKELGRRMAEFELGRASMQKDLEDQNAAQADLAAQLQRLGDSAQALIAAQGTLKDTLDKADELRRARAAAESRAALYRDLALKFKHMVDAGSLAITLRQGRMVLRLSNDVLFDSGRAELKPEGEKALAQVAAVLATIPGRHLQVGGHTDNEPIRLSPYRSNWDLSTARALAVTSFLIARGIDPHMLSAAGYGEFDPVDRNASAEGKAHNRRTEIALQPNIDEMVAVP